MYSRLVGLSILLALSIVGCQDSSIEKPRIEATSFLGQPLPAPRPSEEFRLEQEAHLARARADLDSRPGDVEALIWVGRRTAYLGRYREAIDVYSAAIAQHPDDARLYRHRGHRRITLRQLDEAVGDLEHASGLIAGRADEIEPDGLPNDRGVPTGTLGSNIWYHLALARYLQGDFEGALGDFLVCLEFSNNPDMLVATSHWLFMTLCQLGRMDEAQRVLEPIHAGMDIIENHEYHHLLLLYQGQLDPEVLLAESFENGGVGAATTAYGVGNWYLCRGDDERATEIFERIIGTDSWAAFGFLAAEAELARNRARDDG